jgi:5-methylcytosine-specific restriction endonuclease McrA
MAKNAVKSLEKVARAARPCLDTLPYRMLVFKGLSQHGVPLYLIAGSNAAAMGAEKALREAYKTHGGECFYCGESPKDITIDHAEPHKLGGSDSLQNLLISCKPCNITKGHQAIEAFNPNAGREWLEALLRQVQDRLNRLG